MKTGYIIRVESSSPEFETDSEMQEGIQADGFFLVGIRDGKPAVECMEGMTTMDLACFFTTDTELCSVLRQAAAIGEGIRNAAVIKKEAEEQQSKKKIARNFADKLGMNIPEDLQ